MNNTGFVAGTLIHTDKGLVPIEQITVGDKVLSRDANNPHGELAYKQVLRTTDSFELQKIVRFQYITSRKLTLDHLNQAISDQPHLNDALAIQTYMQQMAAQYALQCKYNIAEEAATLLFPFTLYGTEDHLFWTQELGWMSTVERYYHTQRWQFFRPNYMALNVCDIPMKYVPAPDLLRSSITDVAVKGNMDNTEPEEAGGMVWIRALIDFRGGTPLDLHNFPAKYSENPIMKMNEAHRVLPDDEDDPQVAELLRKNKFLVNGEIYDYEQGRFDIDDNGRHINKKLNYDAHWTPAQKQADDARRAAYKFYKARVYNIEVEDYHSYFVGKLGIWFHSFQTASDYQKQQRFLRTITNSGFVAGTLVHTDKGLVAIHELKVGDRVLSRPNSEDSNYDNNQNSNQSSATIYKPVLRVVKSAQKHAIITPFEAVFCTEKQPFWIQRYHHNAPCWEVAEDITTEDTVYHLKPYRGDATDNADIDADADADAADDNSHYLDSRYGRKITDPYAIGGKYLIATSHPHIALYMSTCHEWEEVPSIIPMGVVDFSEQRIADVLTNDKDSFLASHCYQSAPERFDLRVYKFLDKENPEHQADVERYSKLLNQYISPDWEDDSDYSQAYLDTVYNIEVADTHNYFVGTMAAWTHDCTALQK